MMFARRFGNELDVDCPMCKEFGGVKGNLCKKPTPPYRDRAKAAFHKARTEALAEFHKPKRRA